MHAASLHRISLSQVTAYLARAGWNRREHQHPKELVFEGSFDDRGVPRIITLPDEPDGAGLTVCLRKLLVLLSSSAPSRYGDAGGGAPGPSEDGSDHVPGGPDGGYPVYQNDDADTGGTDEPGDPGPDAGGGGGDPGPDAGGGGGGAGLDAGGGGGQDAGADGAHGGTCGGTVTTSGLCIQSAQVLGTVSSSTTGTTSIGTQLGGPGNDDWCLRFIARGENGDFGTGDTWVTPITFSCTGSSSYIGCHITSSAQAASTPSCQEGCTAGPVATPGCSGSRDISLTADLSSGPWTINPKFLDPDAWRISKGYWFRQDQEYCDYVRNQIVYSAGSSCQSRARDKAQAACDASAPSQLDIPVTYTCQ